MNFRGLALFCFEAAVFIVYAKLTYYWLQLQSFYLDVRVVSIFSCNFTREQF